MSDAKSDPSLGSTSSSTPESVKAEADELAKDLLQILDKHGIAARLPNDDLTSLLVDFSVYFVNRDYKILQHGISVGARQTGHNHPEIGYAIKLMRDAIAEGGLTAALHEKFKDYVENV